MVKNNIEVDVKVKCIENGTTQAQIAEGIQTTKSYVNRMIKKPNGVVNNTFVQMMEASGKNQVIFAQGNKYFDEQALFKWIIENNDTEKADNKSGISYSTRIQADAYLGFIIQNNSLISTPDVFKEKLIDWMRVVMTLSRETNYNGGDDYVRAISKGVRKMLEKLLQQIGN